MLEKITLSKLTKKQIEIMKHTISYQGRNIMNMFWSTL